MRFAGCLADAQLVARLSGVILLILIIIIVVVLVLVVGTATTAHALACQTAAHRLIILLNLLLMVLI